jgi:hypothetical protein
VSQDFACIDSYNTIWVHAVSTAAEPELIFWLSLYFEFVIKMLRSPPMAHGIAGLYVYRAT